MGDLKTAITESIEENDNIDIESIKKKTFKDNLELQQIYTEELEAKGVVEKKIAINENVIKKIPKMQKLVTEDGIELKIPISYLSREEKVEFINNSDGTISILLKNIRKHISKKIWKRFMKFRFICKNRISMMWF